MLMRARTRMAVGPSRAICVQSVMAKSATVMRLLTILSAVIAAVIPALCGDVATTTLMARTSMEMTHDRRDEMPPRRNPDPQRDFAVWQYGDLHLAALSALRWTRQNRCSGRTRHSGRLAVLHTVLGHRHR